jgi:hypothetical protein
MLLARQVGGYFHGIPPCLDEYRGMMGFLARNCKETKDLCLGPWVAVDDGGMEV